MIHDEEHIRDRMRIQFEQAAAAFGVGLTTVQMIEALSYVTFGTALAWVLGMTEEEINAQVVEAAEWVHRENPEQLSRFLDGWGAASQG